MAVRGRFSYKERTTLKDLEAIPRDVIVAYGVNTCWWGIKDKHIYLKPARGESEPRLPCDPRGGMLFECKLGEFLDAAKANEKHFGKYGLKTFMAAFHGNVTAPNGNPTCYQTWQEYEALMEYDGFGTEAKEAAP